LPTRRAAPWLVLIVGMTCTFGAYAYRERAETQKERARIVAETDAAMEQLESTLRGYEAVLRGGEAGTDVFPGLLSVPADTPEIADARLEAVESRVVVVSDPFEMPVDGDREGPAFAIVLPTSSGTEVAVVDAEIYLAQGAGGAGTGYRIEVFEHSSQDDDSLIASANGGAEGLGRVRTMSLDLWDQEWSVRFTDRNPTGPSAMWLAILVVGGIATALLFALVLVLDRGEARAQRMVDEATRELSRKERHFRALVANSSDLVTVVDAAGRLRYISPAINRVLGYEEADLVGADVRTLVHPDDGAPVREALDSIATGHEFDGETLLMRVQHAHGGWRYLESTMSSLHDDPAGRGIVVNSRDVTERVAFQEDLEEQATHDSLTGLPNRSLLLGRLTEALGRTPGNRGHTAVLFVDLDRFKLVNDSLGHRAGDDLLVQVAERLRMATRPGDVVARFGGDEFVVLAENVVDEVECRQIADRLAATLTAPFRVEGREVFVTASVGMTIADPESDTPDTLLRDADAAMYTAKDQGRARSVLFEEHVHQSTVDRLAEEAAMHRALERDELVVLYQPQVDIDSGAIVGIEALLAWQHPERGLLPPGAFLKTAEETGLIVPFGAWILRRACHDAQGWCARFGRPLRVSVNVSARQLVDAELHELVKETLAESGLAPDALCLEVSESVLTDTRDIAAPLHAVRELGVRVAIDDFGTGYASLAHLKRFPVDQLKIDAAFVAGLGSDADDTVIVAAVIGLAHALGVVALAEGVEEDVQLDELRALRCDLAQGYLFARPGDAASIDAILGAVV